MSDIVDNAPRNPTFIGFYKRKLEDKKMFYFTNILLFSAFFVRFGESCNYFVKNANIHHSKILHSNNKENDCVLFFPADNTKHLDLQLQFKRVGNSSNR